MLSLRSKPGLVAAPRLERAALMPPAHFTSVRGSFLLQQPYAHRGLHGGDVVENSRMAFEAAIARGHGIELDVRLTADGQLVVFHDQRLDRLTGMTGPIKSRSLAELRDIRLNDCPRGETIPSLAEILKQIDGRAPVLLEVKAPMFLPAPICRAVRNTIRGCERWVAVMSFSPRAGKWFAEHAPEFTRGLVFSATERDRRLSWAPASSLWRFALSHIRPDFVACDVRDLTENYVQLSRHRLPVLAWTVRDAKTRARAEGFADQIIYESRD